MDTSALATQLGIGMATGLTTMLVIAVLCIPASWAGNRLIYHHPFMRFILMILAVCLSPFLFIGLVLNGWFRYFFSTTEMTYTWYFGLFPIATKLLDGSAIGGQLVANFCNLFLQAFYGDINAVNEKTSVSRYKELIHTIYPAPPKESKEISFPTGIIEEEKPLNMAVRTGYVSEGLMNAARVAAAIPPTPKDNPEDPPPPPPQKWIDLMSKLSAGAKHMYGIA
jgi:hypothetical protein